MSIETYSHNKNLRSKNSSTRLIERRLKKNLPYFKNMRVSETMDGKLYFAYI